MPIKRRDRNLIPLMTRGWSLEAKMAFYTDRGDGCHRWVGSLNTPGYGLIEIEGRKQLAHRLAYRLECGPIPEGLHVLHQCDTPECVNPAHLFLGTHADNMADKKRKGRVNLGPANAARQARHVNG